MTPVLPELWGTLVQDSCRPEGGADEVEGKPGGGVYGPVAPPPRPVAPPPPSSYGFIGNKLVTIVSEIKAKFNERVHGNKRSVHPSPPGPAHTARPRPHSLGGGGATLTSEERLRLAWLALQEDLKAEPRRREERKERGMDMKEGDERRAPSNQRLPPSNADENQER